ncbi:hypothetical protein J0H58_26130 [bacterium]|nr:hypothetical protein [bacterium]
MPGYLAGDPLSFHAGFTNPAPIRAMLRAQAIRAQLAELGGDVAPAGWVAYTEADLRRAATDAVRAGFLRHDDPILAGVPIDG